MHELRDHCDHRVSEDYLDRSKKDTEEQTFVWSSTYLNLKTQNEENICKWKECKCIGILL